MKTTKKLTIRKLSTLSAFIPMIAVTLFSCKTMYIPNAQNVPAFKEKGDIRLNIGTSDAQAGYAVTDNIGVIANGQFNKSEWSLNSGNYQTKYTRSLYAFELGSGYYKPLSDFWIFEAYGGGGIGKSIFNITEMVSGKAFGKYNFSVNQTRFFAQPAITLTTGNFDLALSARCMGVKFGSPVVSASWEEDVVTGEEEEDNEVTGEEIEDNFDNLSKPLYSFIEPALTIRWGKDNINLFSKSMAVKLYIQALHSTKLNSDPLMRKSLVLNWGANIGLNGSGKGGSKKGFGGKSNGRSKSNGGYNYSKKGGYKSPSKKSSGRR